jgi:hypothetical protein
MLDQIKQGFKLRKVVNNNNFREEEKDALKEALSNIRSQVQEEEDNNDEWNGEGFRILGGGFSQNYLNKKYGASDYQYTQDNKNRIMELQKQRDFYGF